MVVKGGMWLSRVGCAVVVKGGMWLSRVECGCQGWNVVVKG